MTTLYIANCSNHRQMVNYRLPEVSRVITFPLGLGEQKPAAGGIANDLNEFQISSIIEQLSIYGFHCIDDISQTNQVTGLIYSVGKPISWAKIEAVRNRNFKFLTDQGAEMRKQAAVAASNVMNADGQQGPNALEMTVVEEKSGGLEGIDHSPVSETVVVSDNMEEAEQRANGKPRGAVGRPRRQ